MKPTHTMQVGKARFPTRLILCILLTAALASLHPISCSDVWWELSKGRAAAAGNWSPSNALLAGAVQRDGDWASGLPFYLMFSGMGVAGLWCFKIVAAIYAARLLIRQSVVKDSVAAVLIAASLISARQAWEPSSLCFDTLGILAVLTLTKSMSQRPSAGQFIRLLLLMICWSNFAARSVTGILIALPFMLTAAERPVTKVVRIAMLVVAASMTPAGSMTLLESWKTTFPLTVESPEVLRLADWSPWWENLREIECVAWLFLCVIFFWQALRCRSVRWLPAVLGTQVLAAMSSDNLPLAAMVMAFAGIQLGDANANSHAKPVQLFGHLQKVASIGFMAVLAIWALLPWRGCGSGMGWGLDPRLSPDAFSASLNGVNLVGSAHCVGLREAGLLSWHIRSGVKPFDTPRTALLNGRLKSHVLLTSDLSKSWKVPHRRPDDSWGGWWLPLQERETTAIVVPSESLSLINALEPTIWKPLSLNSVSIVYGKAGDPGCSQQIINTLSLREFVNRGTWIYQTSSEESKAHTDLLELLVGDNTDYESLRLARVFRAMNISVAALKVLSMLPVESHSEVREEYAKNQLLLGYEERIQCGRSSQFRLAAWRLTADAANPADTNEIAKNVLNVPIDNNLQNADFLTAATQLYVHGDYKAAIQKLNVDDAEALYAKALILLESGQVKESKAALQQFIAQYSDHRLTGSVRFILASLLL